MSCILRLGTCCPLGPKSEASCKEKTEGQGRQTGPAEEAASELCPMRQPDIIRGCDGLLSSLTTPRTGHTQTSFPSLCSDGEVGRQVTGHMLGLVLQAPGCPWTCSLEPSCPTPRVTHSLHTASLSIHHSRLAVPGALFKHAPCFRHLLILLKCSSYLYEISTFIL